jgi:hypothetical protein
LLTGFPIFWIAFTGSLFLTPLARIVGLRLGIVDNPGELSLHTHSTPRTGGPAMFVGFLAAIGYAWATGLAGPDARILVGVLVGCGLVALAGFFDDLKRISPLQKFVWQLLAAIVVIGFGVEVKTFPLAGAGILLALFCLVGGANALNLLDGMDGLAAGTTAIAAFFFAILASRQGNTLALMLAMAIVGTTLGFLPYNLPIAECGMRNAESTECGLRNADCGMTKGWRTEGGKQTAEGGKAEGGRRNGGRGEFRIWDCAIGSPQFLWVIPAAFFSVLPFQALPFSSRVSPTISLALSRHSSFSRFRFWIQPWPSCADWAAVRTLSAATGSTFTTSWPERDWAIEGQY